MRKTENNLIGRKEDFENKNESIFMSLKTLNRRVLLANAAAAIQLKFALNNINRRLTVHTLFLQVDKYVVIG
jgi:hypothetical protein